MIAFAGPIAMPVTVASQVVNDAAILDNPASASQRPAHKPSTLFGIKPSAYKGRYYVASHDRIRMCIVRRESNGHYDAVNRHSAAAGAYQFMPFWQRKLPKMIGMPELRSKKISKWPRYAQDKAFWRVWNHGKGKMNWYYRGHRQCW